MQELKRIAYITPENVIDIKRGYEFMKDNSVVFILPDSKDVASVDDGFASCIYVDEEYVIYDDIDDRSDIDIMNEFCIKLSSKF